MTRLVKGALLFFFFSLCGFAIVKTDQARFQRPPPEPHDLYAVVEQQLTAFRVADYPSAYRYAASGVQQKFALPQFKNMIRRDYGEMRSGQRIEFGSAKISGSMATVQVFFPRDDGSTRALFFSLIAEGSSWKINGVWPGRGEQRPAGLRI